MPVGSRYASPPVGENSVPAWECLWQKCVLLCRKATFHNVGRLGGHHTYYLYYINAPIMTLKPTLKCQSKHNTLCYVYNTRLIISSKNICCSSLKREQDKRKWISFSTVKIFKALQYGQNCSSLGVLFLLNLTVSIWRL